MYRKFKLNLWILIYLNIAVSSIVFGVIITLSITNPDLLVYVIYPFLVFELVWAISYHHNQYFRPRRWLFRKVQVITTDVEEPLPDKIDVKYLKMTFLGDIYKDKRQKIHQKLIKSKDESFAYLFPMLETIHHQNEYKITAIYLHWVVIKDLYGRAYITHLNNLEAIKK
jgi:hypothetical protein